MRTWRIGAGLLGALSFCAGPCGADEGQGRWTVGTGAYYSTGTYGTKVATETLYVPVVVRYETDAYAAWLTASYLSINGRGEQSQGQVVFDSTSAHHVTSAGLGDTLAAGSYTVHRGTAPWPWLDVTAFVKFATADHRRQLGTGKNDYAIQIDAYQRAGPADWFSSLGYKVPGSPADQSYHRVFYASAGGSYPINASLSAGATWNSQEALTDSATNQGELALYLNWFVSARYRAQFYASRGFTQASPNWSTGTVLLRTF